MTQSSRAVPETGVVEELRAAASSIAAYRPILSDQLKKAADALEAKDRELAEARATKDGAYAERNQCVALIAKFAWAHGCRVGIAKTAIEGWDEAWHGCVYIDLPTGQVSWHYHDSDAHLFDFLAPYQGEWDGHSTPEKYARVNAAYPIRPTVLETELAEAREEIERLKGLLNANGKPRFNEAMRRLEKAERERDEAMAALREKEEALRPFAAIAERYDSAEHVRRQPSVSNYAGSLTIEHFRRARSVLAKGQNALVSGREDGA